MFISAFFQGSKFWALSNSCCKTSPIHTFVATYWVVGVKIMMTIMLIVGWVWVAWSFIPKSSLFWVGGGDGVDGDDGVDGGVGVGGGQLGQWRRPGLGQLGQWTWAQLSPPLVLGWGSQDLGSPLLPISCHLSCSAWVFIDNCLYCFNTRVDVINKYFYLRLDVLNKYI